MQAKTAIAQNLPPAMLEAKVEVGVGSAGVRFDVGGEGGENHGAAGLGAVVETMKYLSVWILCQGRASEASPAPSESCTGASLWPSRL